MTKVEQAYDAIDNIAQKTDECILMCSLGKDSLVVLDMIAPKFKKIYCVFMYFIKGLEHIERWIKWVQAKYPNTVIIQVPHWCLTYVLRSGLYCVPNPNVKLFKLTDVCNAMKKKTNCEYVFLGMKEADSMNRLLMIRGYADNHYENNGLVFPLAKWTHKEVWSYMKQKNLPEPTKYGKKMSGGVGFNEECFLWMREHYPQDLEKFYKVFPMSERILKEYDIRQEYQQLTNHNETQREQKEEKLKELYLCGR